MCKDAKNRIDTKCHFFGHHKKALLSIDIFVLFLLNLFPSYALSQVDAYNYFNILLDKNDPSICKSIVEFENSFYGCGMSLDSISNYKTIVTFRLNLDGSLIYWKEFRRNNTDHYPGHESSFHYIGNSCFFDGGTAGLMGHLRKINITGDTVWTQLLPSHLGNQLIIDHCRQLHDKGFICTGQDDYLDAYPDGVLIRTDSLGNEIWRSFFGNSYADKGFKVLPSGLTSYIISGYTYLPEDGYSGDALLLKADSFGTIEWQRTLGHPEYMDGYGSVTIAPDGNFVFGYAHAVSQGPPYPVPYSYCKIKFIKYDQNGDTIWEKLYGKPYQLNMLRNIITLHDGSFVAVGYANSDTLTGPMQGWLFKINQYGDSIWYRDYRHYQEPSILDYLYDVYETSDHGLIACGESSRAEPGPDAVQRMWVLKLDSAGCAEPGCDSTVWIDETGGGEAWMRGELEVWPNPCSEILNFKFSILNSGRDYSMDLYDIFGRLAPIPRFRQVPTDAGTGSQIDVSGLPAGIYLVVVRNETGILGSAKFIISH